MRTLDFLSLSHGAPLSVKAGSVILAAVLISLAALPVLSLGASVVA
jgi:hypothetical protein